MLPGNKSRIWSEGEYIGIILTLNSTYVNINEQNYLLFDRKFTKRTIYSPFNTSIKYPINFQRGLVTKKPSFMESLNIFKLISLQNSDEFYYSYFNLKPNQRLQFMKRPLEAKDGIAFEMQFDTHVKIH